FPCRSRTTHCSPGSRRATIGESASGCADRRSYAPPSAAAIRGRPNRRTPPQTTHLRDFPCSVKILRERHPFEGRVLQALGAVHRRDVALLLVVLPDGSRSLIPAGWTDLAAMPIAKPAVATENGRLHSLARLADFLHARTILDALLSRVPSPRPNPATTEESCRAI